MDATENMETELSALTARLAALTEQVRAMRMLRKLEEYPAGHPEEPADLKAYRRQNPRPEVDL